MIKLINMNKSKEGGAAAMLTVIFLAILLTIITISFVRLSINEQRQSIDDDLTSRAFYAAESGVEDAKRAIGEYYAGTMTLAEMNNTICDAPDSYDNADSTPNDGIVQLSASAVGNNDLDAAYVCQLIDLTPSNFETDLQAWEGITVPLKTDAGALYTEIRISWHQKGAAPYNGNYIRRSFAAQNLPQADFWTASQFPAMLRVNMFSTPNSGDITRNNIRSSTGYFNPTSVAASSVSPISTSGVNAMDGRISPAVCTDLAATQDGEYACTMTINGLSGDFAPGSRTNYLRINALYRATNLRVALLDSAGNSVGFEGVQALVDVTGRAGSVFRRVVARIGLEDSYPFPDYAILTGDSICKNFAFTNSPADWSSVNPGIPQESSCDPSFP